MDESVPARLAEFNQTLTDALARTIERHSEAGEQKIREQFQPFLIKLEEAAQEYDRQLTASKSEPIRDIPVDINARPTPPLPKGANTRAEFIQQHHPDSAEIDATLSRLLNRVSPSKQQFGAFADWANESASANIVRAESDSGTPAPPIASHGNYENVAQWADSTSVRSNPPDAEPIATDPSPIASAPRPIAYDDFAEWIASTGWKTTAGGELSPDDPNAMEIARQRFLAWKSGQAPDSDDKGNSSKPGP